MILHFCINMKFEFPSLICTLTLFPFPPLSPPFPPFIEKNAPQLHFDPLPFPPSFSPFPPLHREERSPAFAQYDYRNPRCACAPRVNHSRRLIADWYFPDGTRLNFSSGFDDIYESRGTHRVDLRRRAMANTQTGIYCCIIPFNVSNPSERKMLYVGIYTDQEGIEAQYCDQ